MGIWDPTPYSDGLASARYGIRGDVVNAGISAAAIIPYVGDLGKAGKYTAKAARYADEVAAVSKAAVKKSDEVGGLVIGKLDDISASKGWLKGDHTLNLPPIDEYESELVLSKCW